MKTKSKTKKPQPKLKVKSKKLAPGWQHGNASLIALIIVIVAIVAGGVGWMLARNALAPVDQVQRTPSNQSAKQVSQSAGVRQDIVYTDKIYGYQVKLPNDWVGYQVVDGKFFLPTTDNDWTEDGVNSGYASVFAISHISQSEWEDLKSECAKGNYEPACAALEPGTSLTDSNPLLGQNEKTHFLVSWAQAGPNDKKWQQLADEISGVDALRARFSLLGTPNKIMNFQKYTDVKSRLTFQFPSDWKINTPNDVNEFTEINLISPETEKNIQELGEYPSADIMIAVRDSVACFAPNCSGTWKTLGDYLKDSEKEGIIGGLKEITVNGMRAYEAGKVGMGGHYTIYMENKSTSVEIDFTLKEYMSELSNDESQILSSFKMAN